MISSTVTVTNVILTVKLVTKETITPPENVLNVHPITTVTEVNLVLLISEDVSMNNLSVTETKLSYLVKNIVNLVLPHFS